MALIRGFRPDGVQGAQAGIVAPVSGGSQIGVTGLAVMGANLARNIASRDVPVAVHNRSAEKTRDFMEQYGDEGKFAAAESLEEFADLPDNPPRNIVMDTARA